MECTVHAPPIWLHRLIPGTPSTVHLKSASMPDHASIDAHCIWSTFAALLPYLLMMTSTSSSRKHPSVFVTAFHSYPIVEDKSVRGHNFN